MDQVQVVPAVIQTYLSLWQGLVPTVALFSRRLLQTPKVSIYTYGYCKKRDGFNSSIHRLHERGLRLQLEAGE
jgi:hypothetical protein